MNIKTASLAILAAMASAPAMAHTGNHAVENTLAALSHIVSSPVHLVSAAAGIAVLAYVGKRVLARRANNKAVSVKTR